MNQNLLLLVVSFTIFVSAYNSAATSQSATGTMIPTSSKAPDTVTAILTPRPATETPTSTPDINATVTAIINAVMTISAPRLLASYSSPDNQWRVEIIIYDCVHIEGLDPGFFADIHAYEQLKLVDVRSGATQVLDNQYQSCGGLGAFGLEGRFWSSNSQYFYYTDAREGVPDGLCGYWERSFLRLDITNRSTEFLGMGTLSPDRTKLATWQNSDLVVWSLDEGQMARSPALAPAATQGPIIWSPDGEALIYLQTDDNCFPFGKSYVVRLDLPELKPELLIGSTDPTFTSVTWDAPSQIKLSDKDGKVWNYDFVTKDLQPVP